jgi:hypothetical protein
MALNLTDTANMFVNGISTAVRTVTSKDITTIEGFSQNQLHSLAQQAALIAGMIEANQFTDDERDFYLIGLKQMAIGFVQTLVGIIEVEIEKIVNAVLSAIYRSINAVAHSALAIPA